MALRLELQLPWQGNLHVAWGLERGPYGSEPPVSSGLKNVHGSSDV